ncbi:MAG TPA: sigma factor [Pyrinomonadaceae bacterium]|jgi:DNA-directed RNA polymerase specialized sigma24 family protein
MSSQADRKQLGERLHQRLLTGSDLTVTGEIAEAFMSALARSLAKEFPRLRDPHLIDTAVADALVNLFERPKRFDPSRAELFTYLRVRARSYLLNSLRREKGSENKVVELDDLRAVYDVGAEAALISREFQAGVVERLRRVFTEPEDLRVVALLVENERKTEAFAEALGITGRPPEEQRKLVKQAKDRINKILDRKFGRKKKRRES